MLKIRGIRNDFTYSKVMADAQMPPPNWPQITMAMALSDEQVSRLLHIRKEYLSSVCKLLTDRKALFRKLQVYPNSTQVQKLICQRSVHHETTFFGASGTVKSAVVAA